MSIFNKKEDTGDTLSLEEQMKVQAKKLGLSVNELKKLGEGKKCPKYGTQELLHARKVRGGKIVVFNISEKHRGEKISTGRKALKSKNDEASKKKD